MSNIVSIITPSFNRADLINETAESIFNQTSTNWEWIIVDDGSTDDSWSIIEGYAKKNDKVKIFKRDKEPKGACTCRNIGVENSSGKYVMFLDTDDLIEPFCIQNRLEALNNNPDIDFGIFPSLMFKTKPHDLNLWWNIDKSTSELERQFYQDAICQGTGILITKEAFVRVGMWNPHLYLWQDIELYFKLYIQDYKYKKFFNLPPDLHNRINDSSLSRGNFFDIKKTNSRFEVIKTTLDLLLNNNKQQLVHQLKYMLAEITEAYFKSKHFKMGRQVLEFGLRNKIISKSEMYKLSFGLWYYNFKLYKVELFRNLKIKLTTPFQVENTLAKIPYKS